MQNKRATARKGKDMTAIRFAISYKEHPECLSSYEHLDSLFALSYKAKKHGCMDQ